MLLVIDRSEAKGVSAASVHFRRMAWLLLFGLLHFYFLWFGDILSMYALVGMVAWLFRKSSSRKLITWGVVLVAIQFLLFAGLAASTFYLSATAAAPDAPAQAVKEWEDLQRQFGVLTGQPLMEKLALFRGPYSGLVEHRLIDQAGSPFTGALMFGWETLAYMLFGMAALKSGFFKGEWSAARYRKIALTGFAIGIPAYAFLAWLLVRDNFSVPMVMTVVMAGTTPFRPLMVIATAALIILLTRKGGALVDRIAAAGRAAFTNYLGTSIVLTTLFYGYGGGLYGHLGRAELWLVVIAMWALMLLWSKPWLDRNLYGPFEWLWRTLARWEWQPMRRRPAAAPAPAE
jgi:uncharacterized protein